MVAGKILLAGDFASLEPSPAFIMAYAIIILAFQESYFQSNMALLLPGLARIFHGVGVVIVRIRRSEGPARRSHPTSEFSMKGN
mgnify:FL=1|jgi:hypothetical protein